MINVEIKKELMKMGRTAYKMPRGAIGTAGAMTAFDVIRKLGWEKNDTSYTVAMIAVKATLKNYEYSSDRAIAYIRGETK